MAIRFDASTDALTGGGVTGTVASVTCWFRVATDRNAFSNIWMLWNSGTTTVEAGWGTDSDGTSCLLFDGAFSTQAGPNVTAGTWYCMGAVLNGTTWTLYYGTDPASLTTVGPNTRTAISSPGGISVSDPTDWLNGDIANFKVWARALSAGDVANELNTYSVVDSTSLVRQHTFYTSPGTTNGAGSGGNLTAGSTSTATSAGPSLLDVGAVSAAVTAGTTATGLREDVGAVSAAVTAADSVSGLREDVGAVDSTITAGVSTDGAADSPGAVSSAITAGDTVSGLREDFGAVTSAITAGDSVDGSVDGASGDVTSTITAEATADGLREDFGAVTAAVTAGAATDGLREDFGAVTATTTAGVDTVGAADSPGAVSSSVTAGVTAAGTAAYFGAVSSSITAGVDVAGVDLTAFTAPLLAGSAALTRGHQAATATLTAGLRAGTAIQG